MKIPTPGYFSILQRNGLEQLTSGSLAEVGTDDEAATGRRNGWSKTSWGMKGRPLPRNPT